MSCTWLDSLSSHSSSDGGHSSALEKLSEKEAFLITAEQEEKQLPMSMGNVLIWYSIEAACELQLPSSKMLCRQSAAQAAAQPAPWASLLCWFKKCQQCWHLGTGLCYYKSKTIVCVNYRDAQIKGFLLFLWMKPASIIHLFLKTFFLEELLHYFALLSQFKHDLICQNWFA